MGNALIALAERVGSGKGVGERDDGLPFVEEPLGDVFPRVPIGSGHGMDGSAGIFMFFPLVLRSPVRKAQLCRS